MNLAGRAYSAQSLRMMRSKRLSSGGIRGE
jgi:hypothetical protein